MMEEKQKEWRKVLLEPASLNDARLHVAECRVKEEEERRTKEVGWMVDIMRKLLYALDQQSLEQSTQNLETSSTPGIIEQLVPQQHLFFDPENKKST